MSVLKKIVLISCANKKKDEPAPAQDLYTSSLFKKNLQYAKLMKPDNIFILSAKLGLLPLNKEIAPYDKSLNDMKKQQKQTWAEKVINDLKNKADLDKDRFIILAGKDYRKFIEPYLNNYEAPLKNKPIGRQLEYLNSKIDAGKKCSKLHKLFRRKMRFTFPFDEELLPQNGIYVLFEKGENGHNGDRIVRIGTHTGENELINRLNQHFIKENKDRSIFRKNLGRCFLNRISDPFLEKWNLDLISRANREKHEDEVDFEYQQEIEHRVTGYLQGAFSFAVIQVSDKERRASLEARLISTISTCDGCEPSQLWFGNYSPKKKIRESGLWQEQHLYK